MNKWQKIVSELSKIFTQAQLAEKIGRSQATISDISTGKQKAVQYEDGEALLKLYRRFAKEISDINNDHQAAA